MTAAWEHVRCQLKSKVCHDRLFCFEINHTIKKIYQLMWKVIVKEDDNKITIFVICVHAIQTLIYLQQINCRYCNGQHLSFHCAESDNFYILFNLMKGLQQILLLQLTNYHFIQLPCIG